MAGRVCRAVQITKPSTKCFQRLKIKVPYNSLARFHTVNHYIVRYIRNTMYNVNFGIKKTQNSFFWHFLQGSQPLREIREIRENQNNFFQTGKTQGIWKKDRNSGKTQGIWWLKWVIILVFFCLSFIHIMIFFGDLEILMRVKKSDAGGKRETQNRLSSA